jgi:hypothetical protein
MTWEMLLAAGVALGTLAGIMWKWHYPKVRRECDAVKEHCLKESEKKVREHSGACVSIRKAEDMETERRMLDKMDQVKDELRHEMHISRQETMTAVNGLKQETTTSINGLSATIKEMLLKHYGKGAVDATP